MIDNTINNDITKEGAGGMLLAGAPKRADAN